MDKLEYRAQLQKDCAFYGFTATPLDETETELCRISGLNLEQAYGVACDVNAGIPFVTALAAALDVETAPDAIPAADEPRELPSGSQERPLYQQIAHCFQALLNCQESSNETWESIWTDRLLALASDHLPSGSGFDNGTEFSLDESRADRLVFTTSFHHMDDSGSYCGWTEHRVILSPSFVHGFELKVTGTDKRQIKDYIAETFSEALDVPVELPAMTDEQRADYQFEQGIIHTD